MKENGKGARGGGEGREGWVKKVGDGEKRVGRLMVMKKGSEWVI